MRLIRPLAMTNANIPRKKKENYLQRRKKILKKCKYKLWYKNYKFPSFLTSFLKRAKPSWFCSAFACRFAFGLPHPTHLFVHGGPLCLGKYTYSPLRLSVWQMPGGGDPWEVAMVTPLFAFCPHLLIACFAVNWHLPSTIDKLNKIINNQS